MGSGAISQAIGLLSRADIDLRGGKDLQEELTMEILVARLCRMGTSNKSSRTSKTSSPKRR
jgi:hypothetical protein